MQFLYLITWKINKHISGVYKGNEFQLKQSHFLSGEIK